jgi:hypothetical protein
MTPKKALYEIRTRFRAPLRYVFRWCTDYRADDGPREGERYVRKILRRRPRSILYEDCEDTAKGWIWRRTSVRLFPPDHWHAESTGNYRHFSLDYRLTALGPSLTELRFRGIRTPTAIGPNPPKARLEAQLRRQWRSFGRALEKDYRADGAPKAS